MKLRNPDIFILIELETNLKHFFFLLENFNIELTICSQES